ncbi:hypothetical protein GUJ93_ZPchr0001g30000 [Zizania palustris]|uniref:Uncharacterized protein n=1 Tax=Zizania palustris TaxID=103762 RepID=A0A8J5RTW6_ZIZPA|nr:hypothetical protein GUJ93_ZPchr0001g30000 [Zizania palustris]
MAAAAAVAAALWKARFWERLNEATRRFNCVVELLNSALPHLTSPMPAGDARAARFRIQLAQDKLRAASSYVASVLSFIGAAEILALRGGSTDPAWPRHMIHQLGDQNLKEQDGLAWLLRIVKMAAKETYAGVRWCLSHLCAALVLLDHPGIPEVGVLIEAERLAAVSDLEAAIQNAKPPSNSSTRSRDTECGVESPREPPKSDSGEM